MAAKKPADLSSSLVAVKGKATVAPDATGRQPEAPSVPAAPSSSSAPLNFKVDPDFRRRFRQRGQYRCQFEIQLLQLLT